MASANSSLSETEHLQRHTGHLITFMSEHKDNLSTTSIAISILVLLVATRFVSGWLGSSSKVQAGSAQRVPLIPYWIPVFGHLVDLLTFPDRLLKGTRDASGRGVFGLNLGGATHNIIYSPSLSQSLFKQKCTVVSHKPVAWHILRRTFGMPAKFKDSYAQLQPELEDSFEHHLLGDPHLQEMLDVTLANASRDLPNLVSFVDSMVDQTPWERVSNVSVPGQDARGAYVEASLYSLLRNFIAHTANPSLFGTTFLEIYPDLYTWLWTLDAAFLLLATGAPRFIPIPRLTSAQIARSRLLHAFTTFQRALDAAATGSPPPSPEWSDLADVSPFVRTRADIYRRHGFPPNARAPPELALLWAMNANANPLVFWLLLRVYAESAAPAAEGGGSRSGGGEEGGKEGGTLLARLRKEIAPFARARQPPMAFGSFAEPPEITFDVPGLMARCPLLRACYIEALRLDSAPWALKKVMQDCEITESPEDAGLGVGGGAQQPETYRLRKGEYADVAFDLHFTDPRYWEEPMRWQPERHLKEDGGMPELGSVRAYGGGKGMCKGRAFAEKECFAFAAGFIMLWEMEPAGKKGWKIPGHGKATAVSIPKSDIRVKLRRRDLTAQEA